MFHSIPSASAAQSSARAITHLAKIDLADAVGYDWAAFRRNIEAVRPGMKVVNVSAKTGEGMDEWVALMESSTRRKPLLGAATSKASADATNAGAR